jgi:hypothetical protein
VDPNTTLDVIGVVKAFTPESTITTKKDGREISKRELTIVDDTSAHTPTPTHTSTHPHTHGRSCTWAPSSLPCHRVMRHGQSAEVCHSLAILHLC